MAAPRPSLTDPPPVTPLTDAAGCSPHSPKSVGSSQAAGVPRWDTSFPLDMAGLQSSSFFPSQGTTLTQSTGAAHVFASALWRGKHELGSEWTADTSYYRREHTLIAEPERKGPPWWTSKYVTSGTLFRECCVVLGFASSVAVLCIRHFRQVKCPTEADEAPLVVWDLLVLLVATIAATATVWRHTCAKAPPAERSGAAVVPAPAPQPLRPPPHPQTTRRRPHLPPPVLQPVRDLGASLGSAPEARGIFLGTPAAPPGAVLRQWASSRPQTTPASQEVVAFNKSTDTDYLQDTSLGTHSPDDLGSPQGDLGPHSTFSTGVARGGRQVSDRLTERSDHRSQRSGRSSHTVAMIRVPPAGGGALSPSSARQNSADLYFDVAESVAADLRTQVAELKNRIATLAQQHEREMSEERQRTAAAVAEVRRRRGHPSLAGTLTSSTESPLGTLSSHGTLSFQNVRPSVDQSPAAEHGAIGLSPQGMPRHGAGFAVSPRTPGLPLPGPRSSGISASLTASLNLQRSRGSANAESDIKLSCVREGLQNNIKGWTLGKALGMGTTKGGIVYKALEHGSGSFLAAKHQERTTGEDPSNSDIAHEAALLQDIDHPGIARLLGIHVMVSAVVRGGHTLILFEELGGIGTLAKVINVFGPLPDITARIYTKQLCSAVAHMHGRHIVHRDIKAENVVITCRGQILLCDFGDAIRLSTAGDEMSTASAAAGKLKPHQSVNIHGSALWMAPEVVRGEAYHLSSDIWSVGATVYEMLSGKPPFSQLARNAGGAMAVLLALANRQEIPDIPDSVSAEARDFLSGVFVLEQEARRSAEELCSHPWLLSVRLPFGPAQLSPNWSAQGALNRATTLRIPPGSKLRGPRAAPQRRSPTGPPGRAGAETRFKVAINAVQAAQRLKRPGQARPRLVTSPHAGSLGSVGRTESQGTQLSVATADGVIDLSESTLVMSLRLLRQLRAVQSLRYYREILTGGDSPVTPSLGPAAARRAPQGSPRR